MEQLFSIIVGEKIEKIVIQQSSKTILVPSNENIREGAKNILRGGAGHSFICCFLRTRDNVEKFPVRNIDICGMT